MDKSRVALVRCDTLEETAVREAVKTGIDLLGGIERFAGKEDRLLLKPNVLIGDGPDKLVSPHPAVFRAVAALLRERTSRLSYGDSPSVGRPEAALRKAGLAQAVEETGAVMADFVNGRETAFPDSPFTKRFFLAEGALACDGIVSVSKLKAHGFQRMTGAVKNLFGCVAGMHKPAFHLKVPDPADFGRMLVALTACLKPRLHVMDGIVAMQGNGPRGGDPIRMNVLLFSADPIALDSVMCRLVGLDPVLLPTIPSGRGWGVGTHLADEIEMVGDPLAPLVNGDFQVHRGRLQFQGPPGAMSFVRNLLGSRPVLHPDKCVRCGLCVEVCPVAPKAVDWMDGDKGRPPAHDYRRCIRCYCCQEVCPEKAITVRRGLIG